MSSGESDFLKYKRAINTNSPVRSDGQNDSADLFPGNRKDYPVFTGLLMYFPHACAEVAKCSLRMNEQHNPGEPMHWDKSKSIGTGDETVRHLMDSAHGTPPQGDVDHAANHAWRALEYLERLILSRTAK